MSQGAVQKRSAERKAEQRREQREHEAKMQRQILDWIEVKRPRRGNVLVMTMPEDKFIYPARDAEATDEQKEWHEQAGRVMMALLEGLQQMGVPMAGAAILGEGMTIEDLPPPPVPGQETRRASGIVLPPGTQI